MTQTKPRTALSKSVLIVGAGGFIGGYLAREAVSRGYEVWCGVREGTSLRWLQGLELRVVVFDYERPELAMDGMPRWDYVVYNLGATKCVNFADFNRVNYLTLRRFVQALCDTGHVPDKMVYMSSLSALGPGDERGYTPISDRDIPSPNTRYGTSKIKAETFLETLPASFPWVILRPTGVYGPHEQDYLMMIKAMARGLDFGVGFRRQMLTFIYVEDLAAAVFDALQRAPARRKYIVSEPRAYTQAQVRRVVARALGRRWVLPVRLPLWAVRAVSAVAEKWGALRLKPATLNRDKYRIMAQRNWSCDTSAAQSDWGFSPRYDLAAGMARTVQAWRDGKQQGKENKFKGRNP